MKNLIYILFLVGLISCNKEQPQPMNPNPPKPYVNTDNVLKDSVVSLKGQTWVLTSVRVGGIGSPSSKNDTLKFVLPTTYYYNGYVSGYSLYRTGQGFNLTLKNTPWGNLSGTVYEYNIGNGIIEGLKFIDITAGSSNDVSYYLWMKKI